MVHKKYYELLKDQEKLLSRKNKKSDFSNGVYDRYEYPVLTREHIPLTWRYDLNEETNPYFMERLGVNAVFNSGAIELNGKYYLIARVEGNDRKSFFGIAESDSPVDGFRFWDYPVLLDDISVWQRVTTEWMDSVSGITRFYSKTPARKRQMFMTCV